MDMVGKRIGFLEHHADAAADDRGSIPGRVNVLAAQADLAFDARVRDQIVHAVERAQESGFAAAARADDGRDLRAME